MFELQADKGVRCPFCRQVIETYLDAPPPRRPVNSPFPPESASFTLVMGGNVEAGSKAVPEIKKPYGRGGIVSIGGGNDYIPPKGVTGSDGGGLRSNTRMDDLLPGYVVPPLKDTDDIVSMAMDRTVSCSPYYICVFHISLFGFSLTCEYSLQLVSYCWSK